MKGTILIVDDRIEEKIGVFKEYLKIDGYYVKTAQTLEEADKDLSDLLGRNNLDGIILDFSFPLNSNDASVYVNGLPNGISLFRKYEFKIRTQGVPVVINTTGDEDYKRKYIGNIESLRIPMYNVNHEANPLAQASPKMAKEILDLFNEKTKNRVEFDKIKADKKWQKGGRTGYYNASTGKYDYFRQGD